MAKAWIKQLAKQVAKFGKARAPWHCEWIDPDGRKRIKSMGVGPTAKKQAEQFRARIESDVLSGVYRDPHAKPAKKSWADFVELFKSQGMANLKMSSRVEILSAFNTFERITKLRYVNDIDAGLIDRFVQARLNEISRYYSKDEPERKISASTVNKELAAIRTALRRANDWGVISTVPKFRLLKVHQRLNTFISPEEFEKLYDACSTVNKPKRAGVKACQWWQALLIFAYMTGWRISEIMSLEWTDVDLEARTATTRENKASREESVALHALIISHLLPLKEAGGRFVFPWDFCERQLWKTFHKIQDAAGVKPRGKRRFGFHDLRRGFATMNAANLAPTDLQRIMRHKDFATTLRYIGFATDLREVIDNNLYVPMIGVAVEEKMEDYAVSRESVIDVNCVKAVS